MKIGKTKDGRVWMAVPIKIEDKPAEIMLTWTPQEASQIGESLLKAADYAREESKIIVPRVGLQ